MEDIGGWAAGNDNLNIANYQLGLKKIELWITKVKGEKWNSLNTIKNGSLSFKRCRLFGKRKKRHPRFLVAYMDIVGKSFF